MAFSLAETSSNQTRHLLQNAAQIVKVLLLSAGLISTLLMLKGALMSFSCQTVFSRLVGFWASLRLFLSCPLYICIVINSMVALIAASSVFHHHDPPPPPSPPPQPPSGTPLPSTSTLNQLGSDHDDNVHIEEETVTEKMEAQASTEDDEDEEDDTMEGTWKAITGAEKKQLEKSETWTGRAVQELPPARKELRKLETFNEAVSIRRLGGLSRDPSVGLHEFNKQVEAFIDKFNQNMRLQRQESDQRFLDMVSRGI